MIKSVKSEVLVVEEVITYPCLRESATGSVVMFNTPSSGILVHASSTSTREVGYYSSNWKAINFKFYTGSITLGNEV